MEENALPKVPFPCNHIPVVLKPFQINLFFWLLVTSLTAMFYYIGVLSLFRREGFLLSVVPWMERRVQTHCSLKGIGTGLVS